MNAPPHPWRAVVRRAGQRLGWGLLITAAIVLPLVGRAAWEGRRELELAAQAAETRDLDAQIEHLGRAARWRVPGFGHDERAVDALMELGAAAEARGDAGSQRALAAYREVRRALLGTRGLFVPQRERFHEANERIAVLMAAQEERFGTDVGGRGDPYGYHLELLEEVPGPAPGRALVAALSFVAWLGSVAAFFVRGLDERGHLRPAPAVRWGAASLLLLVGWMVALRYAG